MGRPGVAEVLIIILIVVILFGARRLPEIGRAIGQAIKEFKRAGQDNDDSSPVNPSDQKPS